MEDVQLVRLVSGEEVLAKIENIGEATKFDNLSFDEVLKKGIKVMDTTAFTLSQENKLPIIVFDINTSNNLFKVVKGENIGTRVNS